MIDDLNTLPDITDLEHDVSTRVDKRMPKPMDSGFGPDEDAISRRHIRNTNHVLPPEAGMTMRYPMMETDYPGPPLYAPPSSGNRLPMYAEPILAEGFAPSPAPQGSCVSVADHVHSCKVCSKLYKFDRIWYIIAICFLLIISLLLFKKVME